MEAAHRSERYDRQIRIWGEGGQERLESAHICVFNVGPLSTELLKNLVLPGTGAFTLVDGRSCEPRDLGNNFFIEEAQVAQKMNRAKAASALLRELNDTVEGNFLDENLADIVHLHEKDELVKFVSRYSLVVVTAVGYGAELRRIAEACWSASVPLMYGRTLGFVGVLRTIVPEHCVENCRDGEQAFLLDNLRISAPFPQLEEFALSVDLSTLDDVAHAHVPFVVLLIQALHEWRRHRRADGDNSEEHSSDAGAAAAQQPPPRRRPRRQPSSREEQLEVRDIVRSWRRKAGEENFNEAEKRAYLVRKHPSAREQLDFLEDPRAAELEPLPRELSGGAKEGAGGGGGNAADNARFWLFAKALRMFVDSEGGVLPVRAQIPDMTADTESFVSLQRLFRARADADAERVYAFEVELAACHGVDALPRRVVSRLCHDAAFLRVQRFRSLEEEMSAPSADLLASLHAVERSHAQLYIAVRALDRHHETHETDRASTCSDAGAAASENIGLRELRAQLPAVLRQSGSPNGFPIWEEGFLEVLRTADSCMHNIAAVVGGVAAQECIKLVTKQFVPMNNTVVFNGLDGSSSTLRL